MRFRIFKVENKQDDWPYTYCVQLIEYSLMERTAVTDWLKENDVDCYDVLGHSSLYLNPQDAELFVLRWSS